MAGASCDEDKTGGGGASPTRERRSATFLQPDQPDRGLQDSRFRFLIYFS